VRPSFHHLAGQLTRRHWPRANLAAGAGQVWPRPCEQPFPLACRSSQDVLFLNQGGFSCWARACRIWGLARPPPPAGSRSTLVFPHPAACVTRSGSPGRVPHLLNASNEAERRLVESLLPPTTTAQRAVSK